MIKIVHVLFNNILYFYKFYVMEHIMYFAFNKNQQKYYNENFNLLKRFKLYNYIIVLYKWRKCY